MQSKDSFEEFIKREVNRIEFDEADSMWQEFQVLLESEKQETRKGFWFRAGIISLFLFIALGGLLLGSIFNQLEFMQAKKDEGVPIAKEFSPSTPPYSETQPEQNSNYGLKTNDFGNNAHTGRKNYPYTHSAAHNKIVKSEFIGTTSEKDNLTRKLTNNILNQRHLKIQLTGVVGPTQTKKAFKQGALDQAVSEEIHGLKSFEDNDKPLQAIARIETGKLLPLISENNPPFNTLKSVWEAPSPQNQYFSIKSSFGNNGIRQIALGLGKRFSIKKYFSLSMEVGGSLDVGYSFSQDSIFIYNGLSIREVRKDKDLLKIGNTYLDLGVCHIKNHWQFGLGIRGNYALFNQCYYVESTSVTHMGTFSNTVTETNNERKEKGNWSGINRMGFDAYLNINYQINTNHSVGLFVGKRLNALIKSNMANQSYSNTPVKIGVAIDKYF